MHYKTLLTAIAFLWTSSFALSQECITPFDFNDWSMEGTPDGSWELLGSNDVIQTSYVFPATFFVSQQNMINVLIKGTISVETTFDVDFMGIVFGYKKPTVIAVDNTYNFFLFDWKSVTASVSGHKASEGFRLSYYNGFISRSDQKKYFWGATDEPPKRNLLQSKYGNTLGWQAMQKYQIELLYTSSLIRITIDDIIIFEQQGCFSSGKFGFYCMSQELTRFENFTYQSFIDFTPSQESVCIDETITFYSFNLGCSPLPDFIESMNWNFDDGSSSTEINPEHSYSESGEYNVELIVIKTDGCNDTIVKAVNVKPSPSVDLGTDKIAQACSTLIFDADNPGSQFLWSTGEETQSIEIDMLNRDTTVWVRVNKDGCLDGDTINIFVEAVQNQLFFPNAFTPNNDGNNDLFMAIGSANDVSFYHLMIYNRWGQMIFETDNPLEGWDGSYEGKFSSNGVYVYKVSYTMGKFCSTIQEFSNMATVTLVK